MKLKIVAQFELVLNSLTNDLRLRLGPHMETPYLVHKDDSVASFER